MVTDFFGALLQDISRLLKIKELVPDKNNSCLVKFPNGVEVQFEMQDNGEFLLMGTNLGQVPPGRYRTDLFREALKANGMPERLGILSYSKAANSLVLFERMYTKELSPDRIVDFLPPFLEKAAKWKDALTRGEVPQISTVSTGGRGGIFGLRP